MTVQWKPTLRIFRVVAKFLKAEGAIVADEDIDAIIASRTVKRRYDELCHADSARTPDEIQLTGPLPQTLIEGTSPTGASG